MSHLKSIYFKNFRVFKSKYNFETCPITFLTGPNSSGKSSFLKGLLLLKSNKSSNLQVLDFSGTKHNLGTFENTVNKKSSEPNITFGIKASLALGEQPFLTFIDEPVTTKRNVYTILKETDSKSYQDVTMELTYRQNERSGKLAILRIIIPESEKPILSLTIGHQDSRSHTLRINYQAMSKNSYFNSLFFGRIMGRNIKLSRPDDEELYSIPIHFSLKENGKNQFYDEPVLVFSKLFEKFLSKNIESGKLSEIHSFLLGQPIRQLLSNFASIINNSEYIEAVRANTKRLYTNDAQGTSFNDLILEYHARDLPQESKVFINKWLCRFGISDEIVFDNIEGVATSIYLVTGEERIALADLGYGITQFLPILLKIALEVPIKKVLNGLKTVKKLILLEEPETNLHPNLQSLLSDFLIDATKTFEIRFLVETHSEYLIRKSQLNIAEQKIPTDYINLFYFNPLAYEKEYKVQEITINGNGTLSDSFGKGFIDEATDLKLKLLQRKAINK
ncbi:AAA family ATPase [Saccharicrinis aurantiacus]|uniref:AAA family ATPase n=1 Tax=Saccharicrinis aurantiacus TaxID=1849719 RepID=UPI002492C0D2|nr:AAA family ATPase [Saccharicrinis aurantiacus]